MLQALATGLGCLIMAVGFALSAGKLPVVALTAFASIFAVWFYYDQAEKSIRIDRGVVIGAVVGALGPLIAFGFLGLVSKIGWRPAEDLTALSNAYEGRGLSASEISVVYNIYVGDPVLNEVKRQLFLLTGLVGLVCGAVTAVGLGGWNERGSYVKEKLYNWNMLYRPGEAVALPASAVKAFQFARFLLKTLSIVIAISLVLYAVFSSGFLGMLLSLLYLPLMVLLGLSTVIVYLIAFFLIPFKGHYMPARVKAATLAFLALALLVAFAAIVNSLG